MFGTYRLRKKIERRVLGLSGHPARLLRSLITGRKPWKQNMIDISRPEGIGDILMCTPALREIKLLNPGIRIRFYTDLPQLVTGLPYIDEVLPMKEAPSTSISLKYEDAIPSFQHLARIMGDCIGIRVRDVTPDVIVQKKLADHYRNEWGVGKTIVALMSASKFTPNKDWPLNYWKDLLKRLSQQFRIVLIGSDKVSTLQFSEKCVDLRNRTRIDELVSVIAAADLYIGPISGPYHIAAATGRPSVVIGGGYELPENTYYKGSVILSNRPECSPCWLRTQCPHEKKCLTAILPSEVEEAVLRILKLK
jgi:ADP-heptose:LPS heptosyltransferase